jgi:hypothetical protein
LDLRKHPSPDRFAIDLSPHERGEVEIAAAHRIRRESGKPVAKIQLTPQMKAKAGGLPLVYDLIFPEGDVTDARPL